MSEVYSIDIHENDPDSIQQYGTPRHSGRFPWGSGKDPYQHGRDFLSYVNGLEKQGLTRVEIARGLGMSTTELKIQRSLARDKQRAADFAEAQRLKESGMSNVAIAKQMSDATKTWNESSIRSLLNPAIQERADITRATAEALARDIDKFRYLDVGKGTEAYLNISEEKLKTAIGLLQAEGKYKVQYIKEKQPGTGKYTYIKVLTPADVPYTEVSKNRAQIRSVAQWSDDGGRTYLGLKPPLQVDPKRILVKYKEDGGGDKDGVIEIRRGVADLDLGDAHYAQVRVAVGGTHYLKGMAMHTVDDLPEGIDIVYNSSKPRGTPIMGSKDNTVMKNLKDDPDNPFGSTVRQIIDPITGKVTSALNRVGHESRPGSGEEGSWDTWSRNLASQFLSKQNPALAKQQLDKAYDAKKQEYDEIMALTNPTVKRLLLEKFADGCDSDAVHLKAAAMPRQTSKVILPITNLKPTEVYAPGYENGERLALVRYPHGGIFEIPELTVNNNSRTAKTLLGNARDAIGIHPSVAARLSGADFDGDTVICIPNNNTGVLSVRTRPALERLKDFDPKTEYSAYEGMTKPGSKGSGFNTGKKMGDISNLIADMTIKGADDDKIAKAVRHSMVVIDAEKHNLNWKQSYIDHGIAELKKEYQGGSNKGASTLITRAKSPVYIDARRESVDPVTGQKVYTHIGQTYVTPSGKTKVYGTKEIEDPKTGRKTLLYPGDTYQDARGQTRTFNGESYINEKGKRVIRQTKSTRLAETTDANTLSSGTRMEGIYATYANNMKALANNSRRDAVATKPPKQSPSAKAIYKNEIESLNKKLVNSNTNKPLERQAILLANSVIAAKYQANPDMDKDDRKKVRNQALAEARNRTGASKQNIEITEREWEAIQNRAISDNVVKQILNNTDIDVIRRYATPRSSDGLSAAQLSRARIMLNSGNTQAEVAQALGVAVSTLTKSL